MPVLESVPCFIITILAGFRVAKIHKAQQSYENSYSPGRAMSVGNSTHVAHRSTNNKGNAIDHESGGGTVPLSPLAPSAIHSSHAKEPSFAPRVPITSYRSLSLSASPRQFHLPSSQRKVQLSSNSTTMPITPTVVHLTELPSGRGVPLHTPLEESVLEHDEPVSPPRSSLRWGRESLVVELTPTSYFSAQGHLVRLRHRRTRRKYYH